MTRLAVLSDIHGNLPALEAVLADVETQGAVDGYWVLGDLAAFCPWPSETLARLRELSQVSILQGNTDRYLVTGHRPHFPVRSEEDWRNMPLMLAGRDASFRWTVERLSYSDYEFLRDLPPRLEMQIPGYGRVVAFHATPGDDEMLILPDTPDKEVRQHLEGSASRLALYGHIHRPVDRTVGDVRLVNCGSAGLPMDGNRRPCYALIEYQNGELTVEMRRVEYDVDKVKQEMDRVEHPGRDWVGSILDRAASPR